MNNGLEPFSSSKNRLILISPVDIHQKNILGPIKKENHCVFSFENTKNCCQMRFIDVHVFLICKF